MVRRTQWLSPMRRACASGDRAGRAEDGIELMADAVIKVLLVEDNAVDARMAAELLGTDGEFELTHVERLSEAAEQLSRHRFDAVLLDLMLPDSSGLATLDGVQERAPDVAIVVYSGFGDEDVMFACEAIRGGAQEFLPKSLVTAIVMQRAILTSIERKRQEQRRIRHARHDELTGLANHLLLEERFERAAARAGRQARYLAILSIELDHYLNVVEQMGGAFGDRLLRAVAKRLHANFRKSDTLARFRLHGFTALLEALAPAQDAGVMAAKLRAVMAAPFRIDGTEVVLSTSVGIALYPIHGHRLPELIEAADAAMFEVAVAGGDACRVADLPAPAGSPNESGDDGHAARVA
jgi:diguanylate cyclase (GGDEF)-like protein